MGESTYSLIGESAYFINSGKHYDGCDGRLTQETGSNHNDRRVSLPSSSAHRAMEKNNWLLQGRNMAGKCRTAVLALAISIPCAWATCDSCPAQQARWTEGRANAWSEKQPWLVGANFTPADAINELE